MNSRTARRLEKLNKRKEVLRSIVVRCCSKQNDLVFCVGASKLMQPLIGIAQLVTISVCLVYDVEDGIGVGSVCIIEFFYFTATAYSDAAKSEVLLIIVPLIYKVRGRDNNGSLHIQVMGNSRSNNGFTQTYNVCDNYTVVLVDTIHAVFDSIQLILQVGELTVGDLVWRFNHVTFKRSVKFKQNANEYLIRCGLCKNPKLFLQLIDKVLVSVLYANVNGFTVIPKFFKALGIFLVLAIVAKSFIHFALTTKSVVSEVGRTRENNALLITKARILKHIRKNICLCVIGGSS